MSARGILLPLFVCALAVGAYEFGRSSARNDARTPASASAVHADIARPAPGPAPPTPVPAPASPHASDAEDTADEPPLPDIPAIPSYEDLLYSQPDMIDRIALRPRTPGAVNLYAVGFAGDSEENVFRNEVEFLPKLLSARFGAEGRTLELINSPSTFKTTPIASRTNLLHAIASAGKAMDRDNDILLLFLTSHGSRDHQLLVEEGQLPLDQLTPQDIRTSLDMDGIRWRVIVISACFSGGFIPALREPHTMIITAARSDRTSFGCGNDSQITWFGKAFLTQALNDTTDFHAAFLEAQKTVASWERRDHETPSEPQFWEGPLIEAKLAQWRATLPSAAPKVAFLPALSGTRRAAR